MVSANRIQKSDAYHPLDTCPTHLSGLVGLARSWRGSEIFRVGEKGNVLGKSLSVITEVSETPHWKLIL